MQAPLPLLLNFLPALNYLQRGTWEGKVNSWQIFCTRSRRNEEKEIHHSSICSMTDFISLSKVVVKYWGKKVCHSLYVWGIFFPQRPKSVWKKSILIPIMDQIPCNFFCKTPQTNPCRLYWVKVWREMNVYWILWWYSIASKKEVELGKQILGRNFAHYGHGDRLHFNLV